MQLLIITSDEKCATLTAPGDVFFIRHEGETHEICIRSRGTNEVFGLGSYSKKDSADREFQKLLEALKKGGKYKMRTEEEIEKAPKRRSDNSRGLRKEKKTELSEEPSAEE